jgi:hypothetical protein
MTKEERESQKFADRCRELTRRITRKVEDHVAQRVRCENAERILLANFVSGLIGLVRKHTRFANSVSMQQAR